MTSDAPYLGPIAFGREHDGRFFGRTRETTVLYRRLVGERVQLLHSASGAGKTSLINAGLIPRLEKEGFWVLPVVRLSSTRYSDGINRFAHAFVSQLLSDPESLKLAREKVPGRGEAPYDDVVDWWVTAGFSDLVLHLLERAPALRASSAPRRDASRTGEDVVGSGEGGVGAADVDQPVPIVLIIDQLEEMFAGIPRGSTEPKAFFDELGTLLLDRRIWALFAIREDFLGQLEPYKRYLPTQLRSTFRLDLLSRSGAMEAVVGPLTDRDDAISSSLRSCANDIVSTLAAAGDEEGLTTPGATVEPLYLQVVCLDWWVKKKTVCTDVAVSVDAALGQYYDDRIQESIGDGGDVLARRSLERRLRNWIEHALIEHGKRRWGSVDALEDSLRPVVEHLLHDRPLLRRDDRLSTDRVELGHDRLIGVVVMRNAAWRERNDSLDVHQRAVDAWVASKRDQDLLWDDAKTVAAFEGWLRTHGSATHDERDFLQFSKKALAKRQEGSKRIRRAVLLLVAAAAAAIGALMSSISNQLSHADMTEVVALTVPLDGKCRSDLLAHSDRLRRFWFVRLKPTRFEDPSLYSLVLVLPTAIDDIRSFLGDSNLGSARAAFRVLDDRIRLGDWPDGECRPFDAFSDPTPPKATLERALTVHTNVLCELVREHPNLLGDDGADIKGAPAYCTTARASLPAGQPPASPP